MRNFQNTFETRKRSFVSAFSICMTVPLTFFNCTISFESYSTFLRLRNQTITINNKVRTVFNIIRLNPVKQNHLAVSLQIYSVTTDLLPGFYIYTRGFVPYSIETDCN